MRRMANYGHRRWRLQSAAFLARYPFCALCLCRGEVNAGATEFAADSQRNLVVDHIVPHRGDKSLFWDQANWQTLCRYPCHDAHKDHAERRGLNWMHVLRGEIANHATQAHVERHAEWIPDWILAEISCVTSQRIDTMRDSERAVSSHAKQYITQNV